MNLNAYKEKIMDHSFTLSSVIEKEFASVSFSFKYSSHSWYTEKITS